MSPAAPHVALLLGAGGISPDAALEAAITVTRQVTVVWYEGGPTAAAATALKERWSRECTGEWLATGDHREIPGMLAELHRRRPLHGVATFGEPLIVAQAEAQELLGLPGNPPGAVRTAQSKLDQRRRLRGAGVETIRFRVVRDQGDVSEAVAEVGFPAILKPVHGAASFLVSKVHDEAELRARLAEALTAYRQSPLLDPEPLFVLEQLLVGDEWYEEPGFADYVSVESLVADGRVTHVGITDKLPQHGFVETGHAAPTSLPAHRQRQVLDHTGRIIGALGIRWGATHVELKLTPDGPACIELNARLGGPMGHLLRAATGADIAADVVRLALGRPSEGDYGRARHALYRCVPRRTTSGPTPSRGGGGVRRRRRPDAGAWGVRRRVGGRGGLGRRGRGVVAAGRWRGGPVRVACVAGSVCVAGRCGRRVACARGGGPVWESVSRGEPGGRCGGRWSRQAGGRAGPVGPGPQNSAASSERSSALPVARDDGAWGARVSVFARKVTTCRPSAVAAART